MAAQVRAGGQRFQGPAVPAGEIEPVVATDASVVETELARVAGLPEHVGVQALTLGSRAGIDPGIPRRSGLRGSGFLSLPQGGPGRHKSRAGQKGLFDPGIEALGAQGPPPLRAHPCTGVEALCAPERCRRGDRLKGHGRHCVAVDARALWPFEVGARGTARQQSAQDRRDDEQDCSGVHVQFRCQFTLRLSSLEQASKPPAVQWAVSSPSGLPPVACREGRNGVLLMIPRHRVLPGLLADQHAVLGEPAVPLAKKLSRSLR